MSLVLGVIPVRYGSTRFPGKALATLGDAFDHRTMIEEVWRKASAAQGIDRLVVATDDQRIADVGEAFGAEVMMTSVDHASGTDRVAEVAREAGSNYPIIINIQGDEPLLTASSLDRLVEALQSPDPPEMATPWEPFTSVEELLDPNNVKIVIDGNGNALYFSRSPVPYVRVDRTELTLGYEELLKSPDALDRFRKHQGIYAYRREALLALTELPPSPLEQAEGLEQLRALEAGFRIRVVRSDFRSQSIDTPRDLERLSKVMLEAE